VIGPAHTARRIAPCNRSSRAGANECLAPPGALIHDPSPGANHTPHTDRCGPPKSAPTRDRVNTIRPRPTGSGRSVLTPPLGSTRPHFGRTPKNTLGPHLDSRSSVMNALLGRIQAQSSCPQRVTPADSARRDSRAPFRSPGKRGRTLYLNINTLIGNTDARGHAWHYRAEDQGEQSNHYPGPIPIEDVRRRLCCWTAQSRPLAVEVPATVESMGFPRLMSNHQKCVTPGTARDTCRTAVAGHASVLPGPHHRDQPRR
jgi:hypothetical protein